MTTRWAFGVLLIWGLAACGAEGHASPTNAGLNCAPYGGCDVLEDLTGGRQVLVQLATDSYPAALERALTDVQKSDVVDTAVVGAQAPHTPLSALYHH